MNRWLLEHLEEIGSGLRAHEVPVFRGILANPLNWVIRAEHRGVKGLFVFVRKGEEGTRDEAEAGSRGAGETGESKSKNQIKSKSGSGGEYEVHASGSEPGWRWIGLARRVLKWFWERARPGCVRTYVGIHEMRSAAFVRACGLKEDRWEPHWLRGKWQWMRHFVRRVGAKV